GLLLADALRFISHGNWWLVLFPGLMLFTLVMLFDQFARAIQRHITQDNNSATWQRWEAGDTPISPEIIARLKEMKARRQRRINA
ncbi:DUF1870 family protein, partial [Salmonella enterica subsp. enterica serovar Anatum]|nr:DUF1870 family protein [Salmonella enterica subsp. enterica serovar Anatum]